MSATGTAWKSIDSYKWGDEEKAVKVYIEIDGIGSHPKEGVETTWAAGSVEIRIKALKGENLRFKLQDLHENVDAEKATMRISGKRITLSIPKKAEGKVWELVKRPPTKWNPDE